MFRGRQVAGRMVDVMPGPAGAFLGTPGPAAGSMSVGGGAVMGFPLKGSGPATTWGLGAQAKPCGQAPSSPTGHIRRSTCQPRHLPGGAAGGWAARGRRACTSVLSPVGVWCRGHGRIPDRTSSARRHGGAGFVSQAILYFNFRCIS